MAAVGLEAQICDVLLQRLAALNLSPALPVAWPDVAFAKPEDLTGRPLPYLEAALLPAPTRGLAVAEGTNAFAGLLQVTAVYPQNSGVLAAQEVAAKVIAWFKKGSMFTVGTTKVEVIRPPYVSPSYQDAPYTRTPVTVHYVAYLPQPA